MKEYTLLLEQKALTDVEPVIQHDWKAPLRVPWIQPLVTAGPPDLDAVQRPRPPPNEVRSAAAAVMTMVRGSFNASMNPPA